MNWTEADPGAGDTEQIVALSSSLSEVAGVAQDAQLELDRLQRMADDASWQGPSAAAFRDRIGALPGHLAKLANSYRDAADGFSQYAAAVAVADIKAQARATQLELDDAQTEATHAQTHAAIASATAATGGPGSTAPYEAALEAARARLTRASAALSELIQQRQTADHRVVGALHQAHNDGMKNKSWLHHTLNSVSRVLAKVTIVLVAIAVVAIVAVAIVNPALLPAVLVLIGDAGGVLSATQLVVDGTRKAMGDHVAWSELTLDALGCLGFAAPIIRSLGFSGSVPSAALRGALPRGSAYLASAARSLRSAGESARAAARSVSEVLPAGPELAMDGGMALRAGRVPEPLSSKAEVVGKAGLSDEAAAVAACPRSWSDPTTLFDHFSRHGRDFQATSPVDYAEKAADFLRRSAVEGLPMKVDKAGTIRVYDPADRTFGSYSRRGQCYTFFRPSRSTYWDRQEGALQ